MPIKIIKQGSALAEKVKAFSFGAPVQEIQPEPAEIPAWIQSMEPEPAPVRLERAAPVPPASPAVDMAQVEKAAYESGFRQGERAGMEIAEKKLEVVMRRYSDAVYELGNARSKLYVEVERQVVKLALEVARKIVHREIHADREVIQSLVKVALSHAAGKSAVTVHLNPVDYNYVLEQRNNLTSGEEGNREIVLLADKSIERGGCVVRTECGDVDARIEEEFRELERGFFEGTSSKR
jgi:flagellar assembly protein FliH